MIIDKMMSLEHLTSQEQSVVSYIIDHQECIFNMSAIELAKASYTSPSTVVRLCQKLGESGYSSFKMKYVSEYPSWMKMKSVFEQTPFDQNVTIDDIADLLPMIYMRGIDYTKSHIDKKAMIRCINYIKQSQSVDIYGVGLNYDIAKITCYKLMDIGIRAHCFDSIHWEYAKLNELENKKPVNILISHTGKNPAMLDIAKRLKQYHQRTICISGVNEDKSLSHLCDESIFIMTAKDTLSYSNTVFSMSTIYILDIIMSCLMVSKYSSIEKIVNAMEGSRESWMKEK